LNRIVPPQYLKIMNKVNLSGQAWPVDDRICTLWPIERACLGRDKERGKGRRGKKRELTVPPIGVDGRIQDRM
jgi:hypothetical protein